MIKSFRRTYPIYVVMDLFLMGISFYLPYLLRYNSLNTLFFSITLPYFKESSFIFILWALFIMISFRRRRLFSTDRNLTIPRELFRVIISIFYATMLIGAVIFFAQYKFFSRAIFLKSYFILCFLLGFWRILKRLILRHLISRGFYNINVLIVGAGKVGNIVLSEIVKVPWFGFKVVGFLDDNEQGEVNGLSVLGNLDDFSKVAKKHFVDELIITIPSEKNVVFQLIKEARKMHLGVRIIPQNFEEPIPVLDISYLGFIPLLTYKERRRHPAEFFLKRVFDLLISSILLVMFSPVFLIIAVLIKLTSPGPIFYIQKRVGLKGNQFNFYKFRSMVQNADQLKEQLLSRNEVKDGIIFKIKQDPRITKIGRFLRRYSLDELPQLFNVLKGDMSLVGPRPPTPDEVAQYSHEHMQRLSIRPGVTGLSQVRGRSELTFRKWIRWDIWYVNNWSFSLDWLILWWTIPAVVKGRGAY